jgi:hypothetical protein
MEGGKNLLKTHTSSFSPDRPEAQAARTLAEVLQKLSGSMNMKGEMTLSIPSETGVEQPGFPLFESASAPVIVQPLMARRSQVDGD